MKLGVSRFHVQLASLKIMFTFEGLKNSENAPIHLLFSNLAWGLALD